MFQRIFATAMVVAAFSIIAVGIYVAGCQATNPAPLVSSPSTLVRMFRDNPAKARELYEGRVVMLQIRRGQFSILAHPPIIVSDPLPEFSSSYTTGLCTCRRDGIYTGDNCDFTIVLASAQHR